jgi:hypothetical protein
LTISIINSPRQLLSEGDSDKHGFLFFVVGGIQIVD